MKANKIMVSFFAVMLTVALMFSLCTVSVFAESSTEAPASSSAPAASESGTAASTPAASTTTGTEEEGKDIVGTIVSLSILGVILIVVVLYCIIKREKVGKFFRSLKSEVKKVVWLPWDQVRKNTIVVIIVVIAVSVVIGVLDFAFSQGIINLGKLF
jgi:preprotein translocase subunit SecE